MPAYLLVPVVIILLGVACVVTAMVTRRLLTRETVARQNLADIRNYVLDVNTEMAFVRAKFDPPVPTSLSPTEQIRLGLDSYVHVDWNDAFPLQHGYPADFDVSKVALGEIMSKSDPRNIQYALNLVSNHYSVIGQEVVGTDRSGKPIALVVSVNGVFENDCVVGIWATMIDQTALRVAELTLQKSEEKFSKAFQLSPDAVVISKVVGGEIIDVNEGFTALTGYTHDEVVGQSTVGLGLWKDPSQRQKAVERLRKQGYVRNLEAEFVVKSGETLVCLTSADSMEIDSESYLLSTTRPIDPAYIRQ